MTINPNLSGFHESSPLRRLSVSLVLVLAGGTVLFTLFLLAGNLIFNGELALLANPDPGEGSGELRFIRFALVAQDLSFFIIPSLIILFMLDPFYRTGIMSIRRIGIIDVILVIILAFCAFPVSGLTGQLNSLMKLPDWLSGLEQWMREKEDYANHLLDVLMTPETLSGMWINLVIVAALPAIGEELIFRGVFQRILQDLFKSGHYAVWATSIIFSAIHLQFYGFLPRLVLGLIFGYLFLWSRNIWLPVIAHFVNNAVPTAGAYINGWEAINQTTASGPVRQIISAIVPITIGIIILAWFRRRSAEPLGIHPGRSHPDTL